MDDEKELEPVVDDVESEIDDIESAIEDEEYPQVSPNESVPVSNNQPYQPNGNNWRNRRTNEVNSTNPGEGSASKSVGNTTSNTTNGTGKKNNNNSEQESTNKAGGMATRGALDAATGGAYEKVRNAPGIGRAAQAVENKVGSKIGNVANRVTGGRAGKAAKKADDSGVLDGADRAGNAMGGNPNPSIGNQFAKKKNTEPSGDGGLQDSNPVKKGNRSLTGSKSNSSSSSDDSGGNKETSNKSNNPLGKIMPKNPFQKGEGEVDEEKKDGSLSGAEDVLKKLGKTAIRMLLTNPIFLAIAGMFLLIILIFLMVLVVFIIGKNSSSSKASNDETAQAGSSCNYDVKTKLGNSLNLSGIKVELINCDGKKSSYSVLETIDFEKYVLGVALAEAGPDSPDEALKAQMIAARNFALTRSGGKNTGMCPGNYNTCFYGYNEASKVIRMRACEADQVYWDYTKNIYRQNRGSISLYSPEVNSGALWKKALSSERQAQVEKLADSVKGETLVDSNGSLVETNYVASDTSKFIAGARAGKSYKEILEEQYGSGNTSSAECNNGSAGTEGYNTSSDGNGILHESLSSFLASKGSSLSEYNNTIKSNVDKAGYGTRAGVVAAATTLIGEIGNKYNLKLPYFWGGGHEGNMTNYASGDWGSTQCHTYANGQNYNYCGLDCSGFVSWALYNGGYNVSSMVTTQFSGLNGAQRVSLSNSPVLKAGDILDSSGHVILVIGVDSERGVYKCAEAAGNSRGVLFTTRAFNLPGYWGVNMDGFYNDPSNVRR